ncbi:TonB-dependent receptor [Gluconobacter morbifer]|uniref:TonB-dependent outer membrane receptor n=1 Tax=Gluconobacter morbifer G707 TaxID=1088869 RepID=G6XJ86_9PROT|nr:TonB-dependent receptor [Gluconobacter morbifer]EHH68202.1 tonB-dependent outer membrane receptor [Gluconobacter morbifer G707]
MIPVPAIQVRAPFFLYGPLSGPVRIRYALPIMLGASIWLAPCLARASDKTARTIPPSHASTQTPSSLPASPVSRSSGGRQAAPKAEHIVVHRIADSAQGNQPGGGLIHIQTGDRSVSTVSQDFIEKQAPMATAFQLAAMLPGANVSTSDPMGFSPNTDISVRGLGGDSIGYVLEGMPLNDVAYSSGTPSQFADSENYQEIALSQGAADLDSPVLNAAGGLMKLTFRDPALKAGGDASVSYGSYNTNREFLRLDTGDIAHSGVRGFISYSHGATDNWRGPGRDEKQHVDFKFLKEWGQGNRASLLGSFNTTITSWYPEPSMSSWKSDGIGGANNLLAHYDSSNQENGVNYWRLWRDAERTIYGAAPVHLTLTDHLSLDVTPYAQMAYGNWPGGSTLSESGLYQGTQALSDTLNLPGAQDGTAVMRADYTQRSYRSGFTSALHYRTGWNDFVMGYWYDYGDDNEQQPFTAVQTNGSSQDIWAENGRSLIRLADGRKLLGGSFHTISQTNALFAGDHMSLFHDRLAIDLGFKVVMFGYRGTNSLPGPQYRVGTDSFEPLPRLGVRWRIDDANQLFFNATTSFRAPDQTALYNTYDPSSGGVETSGTSDLRNEYSISEELGYRRTGRWIIGNLTLFNYNFTNRQISTQAVQNGSIISTTMNAGGQTSRGVDVEIGLRPWHHFSPYVSGEYLHATIDNDLMSGGDLLPTKGKIAVRSPTLQAAAGLSYDDGHIFGVATVRYTGHQYATFMNDERMPDHTTGDIAIGYRFSDHVHLHRPTLRMNFINITNEHYLSGVASPTLNAKDTTGVYGTTIAGSSPAYYIGGGFAALFTASTGF